jgi:hypothetical protein
MFVSRNGLRAYQISGQRPIFALEDLLIPAGGLKIFSRGKQI